MALRASRGVIRKLQSCRNLTSCTAAGSAASSTEQQWNYKGAFALAIAAVAAAASSQQQHSHCVYSEDDTYQDLKASAAESQDTYFNENYDYIKIIGGSSNPALTAEIGARLGVGAGECKLGRYADGEISISLDEHVRGKDVYIVQSGQRPVNDHLMELLLLVSTIQRASAKRVTAVIPYYPYKHHRRGVPISTGLNSRFLLSAAADFGRMMEVMGVDRVIACDLERPGSSNESNFFGPGVPVETLLTTHMFAEFFGKHVFPAGYGGEVLVVSPSSALMKKSVNFKTILARHIPNATVKVTSFVHSTSKAGPVDINTNELIASYGDVKGKDIVLVDELIDTGGTICTLARKLREMGAKDIYVYASHALFNGNALEQIERSPIKQVYVTNTIGHDPAVLAKSTKVEQISIGAHIAKLVYAEHCRSAEIFKEEYEMA